MRKYLASIIATEVLCSFLLLNNNLINFDEQEAHPANTILSVTSNGESSST